MIRLDKYLSSQLQLSRSDVKKELKNNAVSVNGVPVIKADLQLDPEKDIVIYNGVRIQYKKLYAE